MRAHCLDFRPVDLNRHGGLCVRFREDMLRCAFGSARPGISAEDAHRYLQLLHRRESELPGSVVHAWRADCIVGQVEMSRHEGDATIGYIHLFYVVPEWRSKGAGPLLEAHAAGFLWRAGCTRLRLSVSETNPRARMFYLRHGWVDIGPRRDQPALRLRLMEKPIGTLEGRSGATISL